MSFVAAIDQGTTSSRFMIFDHTGSVRGVAQQEHQQIRPKAGWVEHDPLEILAKVQAVTAEALRKSGLVASDLSALGITNQRETTLVWNRKTGKPYYNAIVWQDTRTNQLLKSFEAHNQLVKDKTGLPIATYFSSLKLKWLLDNVNGLKQDAKDGLALFGTMDTWLLWNFTGEHKTDVTNASRTQLMNLETLRWDQDLLALFDIPECMLPTIVPSSGFMGTATQGILSNIHFMGMLGDQQAALVGQTCFKAGQAKNTYGTGCFMLMNTGEKIIKSPSGLLTTVGYQFGNQPVQYALEGSIAVTGSLVQWCRDQLGIITSSNDIEVLAASVPDNGDVYFVPAFSGLFAPYWRSDARGALVGLTAFANKGHIARATLEATAYQTIDVLEAMQKDSGIQLACVNVDGGMTSNNLLMQFQADMAGVPVHLPKVHETTCLGAAYAAGLATGYWNGQDDLVRNHSIAKTWKPAMDTDQRNHYYRRWKKAIEKSLDWMG